MDIHKIRADLVKQGYQPDAGSTDSFSFLHQSARFFVKVDANDAAYVQLGYVANWEWNAKQEEHMLRACNRTSQRVKAVKVTMERERLTFNIEQLHVDEHGFTANIGRCLQLIIGAVVAFADEAK